MLRYSLSSDPNFSIAVTPEGNTYWLHFQYIRGLEYVTIENDYGVRIAGPVRICNGQWLIQEAAHNFDGAGNFMVIDNESQYPLFNRFSNHCELQYYSLAEITSGEVDD